jgi:outer membrane protein assembly factor BamB
LVKKKKGCDGSGFRGSFSTWLDVDTGKRRFYVPVSGELRKPRSSEALSSDAGTGSILALELGGTNEEPLLNPVWDSSTIESPNAPIIANGMVFVLSTGQPGCATGKQAKRKRAPAQSGMALYVLDAATGKQIHAVTDIGPAASASTGLALANGRLYVAGQDNAVYCFGVPSQQRQLVEQ